MGLFKILRGDSSRISTTVTPFHDGYAYFTPDDGKLYIDAQVGNEQRRICVSGASVAINDEAPTYTVAPENANLTSGEKVSVAFGKIAKAISSLISHLADTTSHITSGERTGWNNKASASVQKSGTLTQSGWSANAPYTQTLNVDTLSATSNGDIAIAHGATAAQRKAARRAMMSVTGQEAGKLTITADGEKPGADIPVVVTIIG